MAFLGGTLWASIRGVHGMRNDSRFVALLVTAVWLLCPPMVFAQAETGGASATEEAARAKPKDEPLFVGVTGSPPFVIERGEGFTGLSIDLWKAIARRAHLDFELVAAGTPQSALQELKSGALDVVVGPISITADRSTKVDFTQPYFQGSLSIAAPFAPTVWSRLEPFFSLSFLAAIFALAAILVGLGVLLWLAERKHNDDFPHEALPGVGAGVWFALVTMTTVGYGDKVPVTTKGRVLAGIWMLASMVLASSLIAGLAAAISLAMKSGPAISSASDLRGRSVAAIFGTTGATFARSCGAHVIDVESIAEGLRALGHSADALVADRPALQYALRQQAELAIALSEGQYEPLGYGLALPLRSALTHRVNLALLEVLEGDDIAAIRHNWLGE